MFQGSNEDPVWTEKSELMVCDSVFVILVMRNKRPWVSSANVVFLELFD